MKFGNTDTKSYDIVLRKFEKGNSIKPATSRTIRLYGNRESNIDDVLDWLKRKIGAE